MIRSIHEYHSVGPGQGASNSVPVISRSKQAVQHNNRITGANFTMIKIHKRFLPSRLMPP